jgi:methylated-DNA-protein-cysteine methyltransferase-like protein
MVYMARCSFKSLLNKIKLTILNLKPSNKKSELFERVYKVVCKIPSGKVATYGQIAKNLGTPDARKIGWALHANKDPKIPCHRVVNKDGRLAPNFAFNGWKEQKMRLLEEGVKFIDEMHVDLDKYLMSGL